MKGHVSRLFAAPHRPLWDFLASMSHPLSLGWLMGKDAVVRTYFALYADIKYFVR